MALVPTPVTVEDLIDETSDINTTNDGIKTQAVSPRVRPTDRVTVQAADDPLAPVLVASGVTTGTTANKLVDTSEDFVASGVEVGDMVYNETDDTFATVTAVDSATQLSLSADIMITGETYSIREATYWTQRNLGGEWRQSGSRTGNDKGASYTLPVNTATVIVHQIVYPIALAAIGTYPPITSAETP